MKKFNKVLLIGILPLLLTSCAKNKHAIYVSKSLEVMMYQDDAAKYSDYLFVNVNAAQLINLCESEATFILYFHATNCSACHDCSENWSNYLKNNSYTIYAYNIEKNNDYDSLTAYNSLYFPEATVTPRVLIASKGVFIDEVVSTKLTSSYFFKGAVSSFMKDFSLYTATTTEGINYFTTNFPDGEIVTLDTSNHEDAKLKYRTYYNKDLNKDILFVDSALLK